MIIPFNCPVCGTPMSIQTVEQEVIGKDHKVYKVRKRILICNNCASASNMQRIRIKDVLKE